MYAQKNGRVLSVGASSKERQENTGITEEKCHHVFSVLANAYGIKSMYTERQSVNLEL